MKEEFLMKRKQLLKSAAKRLGVTMLAASMIFGVLPANVYAEGEEPDYEVEAPAEETDEAVVDEETEAAEEVEEAAAEEEAEEILTEEIKTEAVNKITGTIETSCCAYTYSSNEYAVSTTDAVIGDTAEQGVHFDDIYVHPDYVDEYDGQKHNPAYYSDQYSARTWVDIYVKTTLNEEDLCTYTITLPVPDGYTGAGAVFAFWYEESEGVYTRKYEDVSSGDAKTVTIVRTVKINRANKIGDGIGIEFKKAGSASSSDDNPVLDPTQVEIPVGPATYQSKEGADGLIYRLYNVALTREPDKDGYETWTASINNKSKTAAEIAHGFFFSAEFESKGYTNEQFVKMLYEAMFGRPADADGFAYWVKLLNSGVSREYVYKGFAESSEFTKLCDDYKVERGSVTVTNYRDQNVKTTAFMSKLYTQILGRKYDEKGIEYWCKEYITNEKDIDEIVKGFTNSKEFKAMGLTDDEYVDLLYQFYLGRSADPDGKKYWLEQLKSGKSRDDILPGFSKSKEFSSLKASYGL